MKWAITLTWSKLMAAVIFLAGAVFSIFILKTDGGVDEASQIFLTCTVVSSGLLGFRQATTAIKSMAKNTVYDDGLSEESSEVLDTNP
jgi:hypothetical protein